MRRPVPEQPGPGQESVWDYPRPPRLERTDEEVEVVLGGEVVARTRAALRVLETSHPPTYYLPRSTASSPRRAASRAAGGSFCEWKGQASYLDVVGGDRVVAERAGWFYPTPTARVRRARRPRRRSTPAPWTAAPSTARWSGRSRAGSTAAG